MTNYEKYFGSPEKAAAFLEEIGEENSYCVILELTKEVEYCGPSCPYYANHRCSHDNREWLESEAS